MSKGVPRRTTWADDTDSDVETAPPAPKQAPSAAGASSVAGGRRTGMASWADSDTDSEVDLPEPAPRKVDVFGESESDDSEEEEDEEEDDEDGGEDEAVGQPGGEPGGSPSTEEEAAAKRLATLPTGVVQAESTPGGVVESLPSAEETGPGTLTGEDPSKIPNLSKKERKALKQKQLDDLDALLGEFGLDAPANGSENSARAPEAPAPAEGETAELEQDGEASNAGGGGGGKKKKKRKKDKKADDGPQKDGESGTAKEKKEKVNDTPSVVVVQPIEKALKTKGSKKKSSSGGKQQPAGAAAMKAAAEAAEKEAKKNKKKRDKKHFNQAPPSK